MKFAWKEKRPGQIGIGNHAYNGTVEVSFSSVFCCGTSFTLAAQVETGAWTGQAFIQYDVMEGGSYEGGVADGRYHGWGRHTDTLGQVTEGQWTHGQLDR